MTLKEAERLAKREMRKHKLNKVYEFRFINDPLTFGECMGKPEWYIALSRPLVRLNRKDLVLDTIKHEVAHAIDFMKRGFSTHDRKWKKIAEEVGCNPPFRATCEADEIIMPHSPLLWFVRNVDIANQDIENQVRCPSVQEKNVGLKTQSTN